MKDPKLRYSDYKSTENPIDVRDYGAVNAYYDDITEDIIRKNTEAVNKAIERGSFLGRIVLIPKGNYICGTVKLQSNLILRIKGNLIGSRDRSDYSPRNFLISENISNLVIEGEGGKIMGEGEYFWNNPILKPLESNPDISDIRMLQLNHFLAKREKKDNRHSPFIRITGSEDILIRNLIIENSPGWTLTFELSNNIKVRDLIIHNNIRGAMWMELIS